MISYELAKKLKDLKGHKNPRWKGDNAGYASKHQFLKRNYGHPLFCAKCGVYGQKEKGGRWSIHWAKKQGREYTHDRLDYLGLCRKCHGKYDWNESKREYVVKAAKAGKGVKSVAKSIKASEKKRLNGKFAK